MDSEEVNVWACLRHAHSLVGSQPLSSILVLYYSALLEPIFLNRTLTNRTPRVRGGSKLHRTLRFCANSNNSANASQSLGVPPSPHHCSILFCFARDFFEKVWAMGLRAGFLLREEAGGIQNPNFNIVPLPFYYFSSTI